MLNQFVAPENMSVADNGSPVIHPDMSRLKVEALKNMSFIFVTELTSHADMS